MTDENIITKNNLIQDRTYDRLAAWGRRWLPLATVFFIALSGVFMELSKVPGLEGVAPWMVTVGGILAVASAGINEFLKRAKELWVEVALEPEVERHLESQLSQLHPELFGDEKSVERYLESQLRQLHPELFGDEESVE